jgi:hypothetical protein
MKFSLYYCQDKWQFQLLVQGANTAAGFLDAIGIIFPNPF